MVEDELGVGTVSANEDLADKADQINGVLLPLTSGETEDLPPERVKSWHAVRPAIEQLRSWLAETALVIVSSLTSKFKSFIFKARIEFEFVSRTATNGRGLNRTMGRYSGQR